MDCDWGQTAAKKKERGHFEERSTHQAKKQCNLCCWLVRQQGGYIASSKSCQSNRDSFGVGTKLKESIFKNNSQINSTVTTRTWVLSTEWMRTWPSTGLVSK